MKYFPRLVVHVVIKFCKVFSTLIQLVNSSANLYFTLHIREQVQDITRTCARFVIDI